MFGSVLTQERLKAVLSYSADTGAFVWKQPSSNRVSVGSRAGKMHQGYVVIGVDGKKYRAHRLAWLYTYGTEPKTLLDHIDGDTANNRIANLREVSHMQNMHNSKRPKHNTSGFKGVHLHKATGKWRAVVTVDNKPRHLGLYTTPEEASAVYETWCIDNRGVFARVSL